MARIARPAAVAAIIAALVVSNAHAAAARTLQQAVQVAAPTTRVMTNGAQTAVSNPWVQLFTGNGATGVRVPGILNLFTSGGGTSVQTPWSNTIVGRRLQQAVQVAAPTTRVMTNGAQTAVSNPWVQLFTGNGATGVRVPGILNLFTSGGGTSVQTPWSNTIVGRRLQQAVQVAAPTTRVMTNGVQTAVSNPWVQLFTDNGATGVRVPGILNLFTSGGGTSVQTPWSNTIVGRKL